MKICTIFCNACIFVFRAEIAALKLELENERNKPPKIVEKIVEVPGAPAVAAVPVVIPGSGNNSGNGDLDAELKRLKEELAASQTELKEVNDRCLQISSSMLPHYLAQQWIQNGFVYVSKVILFSPAKLPERSHISVVLDV